MEFLDIYVIEYSNVKATSHNTWNQSKVFI